MKGMSLIFEEFLKMEKTDTQRSYATCLSTCLAGVRTRLLHAEPCALCAAAQAVSDFNKVAKGPACLESSGGIRLPRELWCLDNVPFERPSSRTSL